MTAFCPSLAYPQMPIYTAVTPPNNANHNVCTPIPSTSSYSISSVPPFSSSQQSQSRLAIPSIHGLRSTRALTAMKLVDRRCCVISNLGAWPTPLSDVDAVAIFGRFGEIRSSRLLSPAKESVGAHLLVRFASVSACAAAMRWCYAQRGLSAESGYTRYCVKFINGRECTRKNCTLRHSYVDSLADVIADPKADSARRREQNAKVTTLRRDVDALQKLCCDQSAHVESLLSEIARLRSANEAMRGEIEENSQLSEAQISALGSFDLENIVDAMDAELTRMSASQ